MRQEPAGPCDDAPNPARGYPSHVLSQDIGPPDRLVRSDLLLYDRDATSHWGVHFASVAADVGVAHVVGQDDDDIRAWVMGFGSGSYPNEGERGYEKPFHGININPPGEARGIQTIYFPLFRLGRHCAFYQHRDLIMDHFHESALDREIGRSIILILQYFYPARFQCAHQGSMPVQYFEQAHHARQLYTIHVAAEQFLFGC